MGVGVYGCGGVWVWVYVCVCVQLITKDKCLNLLEHI